ncbi:GNAT family N-acetyltransferase [Planomicrobium okeanokoites]|uniref:GNAT family N-acetyltransferase n=1 Tax=Planomicrobium okeanokoites TaxID=244 RepID=UPI000A04676E|nr:GNAT family protein [Planomicrobium okeanokoites]
MDIKLRELRSEDVEFMYEFIEDVEISSNFIYTRYPTSKEGLDQFVKSSWGNKANVHFAIVSKEDDDYLGTVSLKNINYVDRNAEYAISIRKKYWGKDHAYNATSLILEYGFNRLNLYKVYFNVLSSNKRAIGFYKKFGFEQEGVFKNHIFVNGKYEDMIWFRYINNFLNE